MKLSITLAQLSFVFGDVSMNLQIAENAISKAAENGSDLILLPELWSSGYDLANWERYATSLNQGVFSSIRDFAIKKKISIGSSILELAQGKAFNAFVLFGADGQTWGKYRKIHRFRLLEEEKWLGAGDSLVMANTPWGRVGLGICYDLRFPEMFRPYAVAGARLILIVAEWPERRISHWYKLLQTRAIENQLFVAGVNKVGESKGVKLGGRSAIINPWGESLVEGDDREKLLTTEIDLEEVDKARSSIPIFKDRRPEVYQKWENEYRQLKK